MRIGLKQASASLPEILYLNTSVDLTRPTLVRGVINERCNYKCLHCGCWRLGEYREINIAQWTHALASLKEFLGSYTIRFSGGEPFIKKGFLDLFEYCRDRSIGFGLITNGSAFISPEVVRRLTATRPLNLDISVDGPKSVLHDRLRGAPGSLAAIERGIEGLRAEQRRTGVSFPIRIKPTINAMNFRSMPALVIWTVNVGASSVDFQPIRHWTEESRGALWPTPEVISEMEAMIAELIGLKRAGAPIETADHVLRTSRPTSSGVRRPRSSGRAGPGFASTSSIHAGWSLPATSSPRSATSPGSLRGKSGKGTSRGRTAGSPRRAGRGARLDAYQSRSWRS
jgi:sulfatase maturation enzyme AslB (radical SAM superfamily)